RRGRALLRAPAGPAQRPGPAGGAVRPAAEAAGRQLPAGVLARRAGQHGAEPGPPGARARPEAAQAIGRRVREVVIDTPGHETLFWEGMPEPLLHSTMHRVTLELQPDTEQRLREKAHLSGLSLESYLQRLAEREATGENGVPSTRPVETQLSLDDFERQLDE